MNNEVRIWNCQEKLLLGTLRTMIFVILCALPLPMTDRFQQGQVSMTREAVWECLVADASISVVL
jgi:hypothetical protein